MFYLISYDISDDKRRAKILKILKSYGVRVQFSVFEGDSTGRTIRELKSKIREIIDLKIDSVRLYPLCDNCQVNLEIEGLGEITQFNGVKII